jgi:hypothetical protein
MLDGGESSTCFHVIIELVLERYTACPSEFSKEEKRTFFPNRPIHLRYETYVPHEKSIYVRR